MVCGEWCGWRKWGWTKVGLESEVRFSCLRRRNESLATECLAAIASASYTLSRPCADDTVSISAVYVHSEKEQEKKGKRDWRVVVVWVVKLGRGRQSRFGKCKNRAEWMGVAGLRD